LLRAGQIVAQGPIDQAITSETLTQSFDIPITLDRVGGRYTAQRAG
jgi:iron complex transport system ATP-binding protein